LIRDQCTFKDGYWWYDDDPLIQLPKKALSPLPAGHFSSDASSTGQAPLRLANVMADTPIPAYKDVDTIVVPLASIKVPSTLK
jgi:hypothetical protein